jgi:DNA-binding NtrC family response regulator
MDEFAELLKKYDDTTAQSILPYGEVLVIDDDLNVRLGLDSTLTQRNYSVLLSSTGQEGIDKLSDKTDVILLDVKLPQVDGTQIYPQLKQKIPAIPIIFYSAYPGNDTMTEKCMKLKPYAFIEKGVAEDIDRLFMLIKKAVSKKGIPNV